MDKIIDELKMAYEVNKSIDLRVETASRIMLEYYMEPYIFQDYMIKVNGTQVKSA